MKLLFIFVALFLFLESIISQDEKCYGKSDIMFAVDTSGSVTEHDWVIFMNFIINVVESFDNIGDDGVRIGLVTFGGKRHLNSQYGDDYYWAWKLGSDLSTDRQGMIDKLNWLKEGCDPDQKKTCLGKNNKPDPQCLNRPDDSMCFGTYYYYGLNMAYDNMNATVRNDAKKFLFVMSDGEPSPKGTKFEQHTTANIDANVRRFEEDFGAIVASVALRSTRAISLSKDTIATYPCLYWFVKEFSEEYLTPMVDVIKELTCMDVFSVSPSFSCNTNVSTNAVVTGTGFFTEIAHDADCLECVDQCTDIQLKCKIKQDGSNKERIVDATFINKKQVSCPLDFVEENGIGKYEIEVAISEENGFTESQRNFEVVNCTEGYEEPTKENVCNCKGKSDVIFVLDSSYSLDDKEFEQLRQFVEDLVSSVCIGDETTRISIIQFTTTSENYYKVNFNLTGDTNFVIRTARNLGRFGKGATPLHSGLKAAYTQIIDNSRPDAYKFVIIVSDGVSDSCRGLNVDQDCINPAIEDSNCKDQYEECKLITGDQTCYWDIIEEAKNSSIPDYTCCYCDNDWITKIKNTGAYVYGIAVGNESNIEDDLDTKYIKERISSSEDYYAHVDSYSQINSIIDKIVDSTCIDVYYTDPGSICYGDDIIVDIIGTGFSSQSTVVVKFFFQGKSKSFIAQFVSSRKIALNIKMNEENLSFFKSEGTYEYAVSIGGNFWSENKEFTYDSNSNVCQNQIDIVPIVASATLGILGFLLVLSIVLLLSLFMCGIRKKPVVAKAVELKEEELEEPAPLPEVLPEPEPEPQSFIPPPKVKRSMYYVGGKAMSVDWGEKGMTWDSPFRGNNMGMGDNYGHNKKNKLYEEIQRRKKERMKRQVAMQGKSNTPAPKVNRAAKPKINRAAKPRI